jgi:hypothetical protein
MHAIAHPRPKPSLSDQSSTSSARQGPSNAPVATKMSLSLDTRQRTAPLVRLSGTQDVEDKFYQNAIEASWPCSVAGLQDKSVGINWNPYTILDAYVSFYCRCRTGRHKGSTPSTKKSSLSQTSFHSEHPATRPFPLNRFSLTRCFDAYRVSNYCHHTSQEAVKICQRWKRLTWSYGWCVIQGYKQTAGQSRPRRNSS